MLPKELNDHMKRGEVILFVGAGLSVNAGLPGWIELAHLIADNAGFHWPAQEDITTEHLLTIFQYYENQYGRNRLLRIVDDKLDTIKHTPAIAHYLITLLPVQIVFTTNYDNLLERAYHDVFQPAHVVVNPLELAYWSQDNTQIVKLCGDLSRPDSIVITKRDFNIYSETHRRLIEQLRTTLETKTALFLGYSLRDPFINQIWDAIHLTQGEHHRMAYAVIFNPNPLELADFQKRGIHVIQPPIKNNIEESFLSFMINLLKGLGPQFAYEKFHKILGYVSNQAIADELKQLYK